MATTLALKDVPQLQAEGTANPYAVYKGWKKNFEYSLSASGVRDAAQKKNILLHVGGEEVKRIYETEETLPRTYHGIISCLKTFIVRKRISHWKDVNSSK